MKFGRYLKALRVARGFKLTQVAMLSRQGQRDRVSHVSQPYLSQIESGKRMPSLEKLGTLASIYGTPIEQLLAHAPVAWIKRTRADAERRESIRSLGFDLPGLAQWKYLPGLLYRESRHKESLLDLVRRDDEVVDAVRVFSSLLPYLELLAAPPTPPERNELSRIAASVFNASSGHFPPNLSTPQHTASVAWEEVCGVIPVAWRQIVLRDRARAKKLADLVYDWCRHSGTDLAGPKMTVFFIPECGGVFDFEFASPKAIIQIHDALSLGRLLPLLKIAKVNFNDRNPVFPIEEQFATRIRELVDCAKAGTPLQAGAYELVCDARAALRLFDQPPLARLVFPWAETEADARAAVDLAESVIHRTSGGGVLLPGKPFPIFVPSDESTEPATSPPPTPRT